MADVSMLIARAAMVRGIRAFFWERGFLEVETPVLLACPSQEPELEPLRATVHDHRGNAHDGFLRMSPEFSIKKLLGAAAPGALGAGAFEIGPVFRDGEPWGGSHNPEFTMLEWYRIGATYEDLMDDCEALVASLCAAIPDAPGAVRFAGAWERLTMREAWRRHAGLDLDALLTRETMAAACASRGVTVVDSDTWDDLFFKMHLTNVEPQLGRERPTFLTDWPAQMAALAKRSADDPRYAERIELYAGGVELANGFSELTDSVEQRARFLEDCDRRARSGRPVFPLDEDFLAAIDRMPETAGIALGVDRLAMVLLDAHTIDDVRWLPAGQLWR